MKRFLRVTMKMPEHLLGTIIADHAGEVDVEGTEVVLLVDKRSKAPKGGDLLQFLKVPRSMKEIAAQQGCTLTAAGYRMLKLKKERKVRSVGKSRATKWRAA